MKNVCPILGRPTEIEQTGFSRESWEVVRCRETGFVFLANPPDYSQFESNFAWEKTYEVERRRRESAEPLMAAVSSLAKSVGRFLSPKPNKFFSQARRSVRHWNPTEPLRLLDIGCGDGHLAADLCERFAEIGLNVIPYGIELSKHLASRSAEEFARRGGKLISGNALEGLAVFEPGSIHLVIMSSFLEHERQPLTLLRRLCPILAPNAAVLLKVPNLASWNRRVRGNKWCGFRFPDHINYFTPHTLRILAEEAGYSMRQGYLDRFSLNDNMYAILKNRLSLSEDNAGHAK
jgi:2-polyprenyl-3-methyl-5-hydroxy-6-metoxy-1,4-benzoquinol methylase